MMNKMLTIDTKRKIDSARDILVGKIPDPKAQVEQITTALIYKFMDDMDQEALSFDGGKARYFTGDFEKYAWHKVMDTKLGAQERMNLYTEAIGKFQTNPNLPSLFRDIFKDSFLPFRDPETLTLFLRQINEFTYDHSEDLGDAYEYLLSIMGSQGDAGQFRTPRHIIEFIVKVVDPKKEDTVLDPACGTAGFLISAYKHILAQHDGFDDNTGEPIKTEKRLTPTERSQITENFVGYDISPDMVRISEVNMFLHDFTEPKIYEYDTLSSEDKWDDRFDVILANPPFMSPKGGIRPHKRFSIQANRSEVLFVDYIMEHLKPKGRAGIIVPEGIIFQSSNAYVELRKKLIQDGLFCVVSLPSGVFQPYSGVKTSILLFDNEISKRSENVLFVKVSNDGYELGAQRKPTPEKDDFPNVLKLISAFKKNPQVTQDKIYEEAGLTQPATWGTAIWDESVWAGGEEIKIIGRDEVSKSEDYNLTGSRYSASERGAEVTGKWPLVQLGDSKYFSIESGGTPDSKNEQYWNGSINWATLADLPQTDLITNINSTNRKITDAGLKNSSAKILPVNSVIVSSRATIGRIAINNVELATNQGFKNVVIKDFNKVNHKFIAYILTALVPKMLSLSSGGTFKEISKTSFSTLEIPLPPIEVQKQIVEELDGYQRIIDLATELSQIKGIDISVDPSCKKVYLGDLATFTYGYTASAKAQGDARFIRITDIDDYGELTSTNRKFVNLDDESKKYLIRKNDVLVARTGATFGKTLLFDEDYPSVFASYLIRIQFDETKLLPEYYWSFAQTKDYWDQAKKLVSGGSQPQFNANVLKNIQVPLPPLDKQMSLATEFLKIRNQLLSQNVELINIFQNRIKDKIDSLFEK